MGRVWGVLLLVVVTAGCAQVPSMVWRFSTEAVDLSQAVGRDVGELHRVHRQTVQLLYDRMAGDVNEFVDEVYAPYQIRKTLDQHGDTLSHVLQTATASGASEEDQQQALAFLGVYLEELRRDIEGFRSDTLEPLRRQEREMLNKLDEAYEQVQAANAVVTAQLASVVKVHKAQAEALEAASLGDLRRQVSARATALSTKLDGFLHKARQGEESVDKLANELESLVGGDDDDT